MTENRGGLVVAVAVGDANGFSERASVLVMVTHARRRHRMKVITLGADAGYDAEEFLEQLADRRMRAHVSLRKPGFGHGMEVGKAQTEIRRRLRNEGCATSQRRRKVVAEFFGWTKVVASLRRTRHVGRWRIKQQLELTAAAFNLVRLRKLLAA